MPSLAMHLAIAKKYLENHKEENEEEFYEGAVAPDLKPILELGNGRLHYGENSHRPGLNRYYQEEGLNSSYNRGYFLHLLTDYLFYNKFLDEYSNDICDDYRKINKKIIEKYDLQIPDEIKDDIYYLDGELKVINENEVYKFIDTVGQLELEQYKTQIKEEDKEHKIKLVGLKEGLLYKHNYSNVVNSHDEVYFYGFENNYGVLVQRIIGGAETEGAREGLFRFQPVGIATKPSKMMEFDFGSINVVKERFSQEERKEIIKKCERIIDKPIHADIGFGFQNMSKDDVKKLLNAIRSFKERIPKKEIKDNDLNSELITDEDIQIR